MSNIKYYTNIVPTSLYSKLLEKGMPVNLFPYAEVFDWLITKGVSINIYPSRGIINGDDKWRYACFGKRTFIPANTKGWLETANDAIYATIQKLI